MVKIKKMLHHLLYADVISFIVTNKCQKIRKKSTKIANFVEVYLNIFWTAKRIWMTFSENMWLMIIVKVTKNQWFNLCSKHIFWKTTGGSNWSSSSLFRLKFLYRQNRFLIPPLSRLSFNKLIQPLFYYVAQPAL